MTKTETFSGVCALVGIGLFVGSNYVNKSNPKSAEQSRNMRIAGFSLMGVALVGMVVTKAQKA